MHRVLGHQVRVGIYGAEHDQDVVNMVAWFDCSVPSLIASKEHSTECPVVMAWGNHVATAEERAVNGVIVVFVRRALRTRVELLHHDRTEPRPAAPQCSLKEIFVRLNANHGDHNRGVKEQRPGTRHPVYSRVVRRYASRIVPLRRSARTCSITSSAMRRSSITVRIASDSVLTLRVFISFRTFPSSRRTRQGTSGKTFAIRSSSSSQGCVSPTLNRHNTQAV